ncbi:hypothetical protein H8E77_33335 [bacterium]|nr:hypothetical protein [bacterium]
MFDIKKERATVRTLAKRVAEIASLPIQKERTRLWTACNDLKPDRPMVLATQQPMSELEKTWIKLECEDEKLRGYERQLRHVIMRHEHIPDDFPIMGEWRVGIPIHNSGYDDYGFKLLTTKSDYAQGAYHIEPVIRSREDLEKLHQRPLKVNHEAADRAVAEAEELFGDILPVKKVGKTFWRYGLSRVLIHMRGLGQMMLDMYDNPELIHQLMTFLRDDFMREIDILESENAVSLSNGPDSVAGSGGLMPTEDLPGEDFDGIPRVKNCTCWAESQETVGVGPSQFDEFVLHHQIPLMQRFGLVDYGCCEEVDYKLDLLIEKIPNLRWISVAPWADRQVCADKIAGKYVYVYKPNPSYICSKTPDWEAAEKDMRDTISIVGHAPLHICMKDTKTFWGDARRTTQWCEMAVRIAKEMA